MTRLFLLSSVLLLVLVTGCASPYATAPTAVHQPMTARPEAPQRTSSANGAIYQASHARPLFEDRRARHVGDTITINLVEQTSAQKSSNTNASRSSGIAGGIASLVRLPFSGLTGVDADAEMDSQFDGQGASAANNAFDGTITVTVIDVYPNGNLLVSGEKQVAINQGNEFVRFSGVVNPYSVTTSNTVQSTQVADARIEYKGSGFIDESQRMGWLQRFFLTVLPL